MSSITEQGDQTQQQPTSHDGLPALETMQENMGQENEERLQEEEELTSHLERVVETTTSDELTSAEGNAATSSSLHDIPEDNHPSIPTSPSGSFTTDFDRAVSSAPIVKGSFRPKKSKPLEGEEATKPFTTFSKDDLVASIAMKSGLSPRLSSSALQAVLDTIHEEVKRTGGTVYVEGFGTFTNKTPKPKNLGNLVMARISDSPGEASSNSQRVSFDTAGQTPRFAPLQPKMEISLMYGEEIDDDDEQELLPLAQEPRSDFCDPQTDPFEIREGRTLTWQNVNMTLSATKKEPEQRIIKDCWGEVPKRKTTAIMGASGAGKTSLLNILAGRLQNRGRLRVKADVRLDNYQVDPSDINVRQYIAFVAQDDSLPAVATPREAIRFSAKLRLPRTTSDDDLDQLTSRMLTELGLNDCADVLVGGALIKGISGGERKRTSVGVELVTKPSMVFLDEPTSGLDSFSALQCCNVLGKVAKAGASVLFTIHQPASEIFEAFDHLLLMNKGRVMYQGSVKDMPAWFGARGYAVPRNYNPADWIIVCINCIGECQAMYF